MKLLHIVFLFLFAIPVFAAEPVDLHALFCAQKTWKSDSASFVTLWRKNGFVFTGNDRESAVSSKPGAMTFGKIPVYETRVYWKNGQMSRSEISIYNRGDALPVDREEFDSLVSSSRDLITKSLGRGLTLKPESPAVGKTVSGMKWTSSNPLALLQWSVDVVRQKGRKDSFKAEFIKVVFVPKTASPAADNAALTGRGFLVKAKTLASLPGSLVKTPSGDVYIEGMPMVDQGQKGYCAAATAERILRYYGLNIDQHQVAQLAETSAASGTSIEGFSEAVKKIGRAYSLSLDTIIRADCGDSFEKSPAGEDLAAYNKAAAKMKKAKIDWRDHATQPTPRSYVIDVTSIFKAMEPDVLMTAKCGQKHDFDKFRTGVEKYIQKGVPLVWSCFVGIYPEVPDIGQDGTFGHMRLIIGYNSKSSEIIYTDSWGGAHALKRMPLKQAWAMTRSLLVLKPAN